LWDKDRGVTISPTTWKIETKNNQFTITDSPGHRDFIKMTISAISQADFALLIIAAGIG